MQCKLNEITIVTISRRTCGELGEIKAGKVKVGGWVSDGMRWLPEQVIDFVKNWQ